jgi:multiple sugar transport system permease protein
MAAPKLASGRWFRVELLRALRQLLIYIALTGLAVLWVLPLIWMISTSLKVDAQILRFPPIWIPNPIDWSNYPEALSFIPFFLYMRNTLIVCAGAVVGVLFSCPLVAYGLSRIRWPGRDALFLITVATMMLPYQVIMLPLFVFFRNLGWLNTWLPLIVPSFFGSAFYIFLLRQFFMTIPMELSDAARIDGASEFGIFGRIILPLTRPAVAVIVLFEVLFRWNNFLGPLIYLSESKLYTISLGLQQYHAERFTEWAYLMAASTLVTLPVILIFLFTQHTFIEGITLTGIKG